MFKTITWLLLIALLALALAWWMFSSPNPLSPGDEYHPFENSPVQLALVDPEMAPESIKPLVMKGYYIMLETQKYASDYAGDKITCNNCHFAGGNTLGGANGGIPLVGVTKKYPKMLPGNKLYTLEERINACFEKSINGRAMSVKGPLMKALIAYMEWISTPVHSLKDAPWLGLKLLHSQHIPNSDNGQKVYIKNCAICHGNDGEGQPRKENLSYPPLWGPHAFNQDAGLNRLPYLSSFIFYNMPFNQAHLSVEDSLDVAAFLIRQPKPQRL